MDFCYTMHSPTSASLDPFSGIGTVATPLLRQKGALCMPAY